MNIDAYQSLAQRTLQIQSKSYDRVSASLIWNALGLAGESGEVVDLIKNKFATNMASIVMQLRKN